MKKRKLLATVLTTVFMASTLLMGCGSKTEDSASGGSSEGVEQVIRLRGYDYTSLDPAKITDTNSNTSIANMYEGLISEKLVDGKSKLVKTGAKSIEASDDGLTYTIKLNTKVKWSDGEVVKAKDYVYAWQRLCDPEVATGYLGFPAEINVVNASEAAAGTVSPSEVGIKAIDDETLEIKLTKPTPYFENALSYSGLVPQRQDIVEKLGDDYGQDFEKMVFNGPFLIDEYQSRSKIVYVKNENYWDAENVKLQKAECTITDDISTLDQMFSSGELDVIGGAVLTKDYLTTYGEKAENGEVTAATFEGASSFYIGFNFNNEVLKNKNIRLAMSLAHDREKFMDVVFKKNIPSYGMVPASIKAGETNYREKIEEPLKAVSEDAKTLFQKGLDELGISDPSQVELKLLNSPQTELSKSMGEFLQKQWEDAFGIKVKIDYAADTTSYFAARNAGEYDLVAGGWGADYIDPASFFTLFTTGNGNNTGKYTNEEYDQLVTDASSILDEEERVKTYEKAEKILIAEDPAIIPNYYNEEKSFTKNYVKGYMVPYCNGYYRLSGIEITDAE